MVRKRYDGKIDRLVAHFLVGAITATAAGVWWMLRFSVSTIEKLAAAGANEMANAHRRREKSVQWKGSGPENRQAAAAVKPEGVKMLSTSDARSSALLAFVPAGEKWWQKPLVMSAGRHIPAELAVLDLEVSEGEGGAWLNSRSTTRGVTDLVRDATGKFKTVPIALPSFVSSALSNLYAVTMLPKGMPDLVIWHEARQSVRLVEVKCPHWDRVSPEQLQFMEIAAKHGVPTKVVEWEFRR